jgi:hypothetical protein
VRGRHIRRRLAFPWPEWVAWLSVVAIWVASSATVWVVLTTLRTGTVERKDDAVTITWSWPWDR